ncbi:uncharacterized protein LOC116249637 [Nymphaea colorata]|uniref:uncharacterized protein LOC116249637 n=1 Tax=Nymphaea colorata TaxID=210225 RepID=UPI00129D5EDE|nr:uncharacterized protein LOC116249637 [Nymphaea colorata]XP_031478667.1 uncharacterized protein LOC116249637 [Nymphaea colorata]XP_031478668.1 uncharacterized protein LOC116249637 [Nymphaea colorata]
MTCRKMSIDARKAHREDAAVVVEGDARPREVEDPAPSDSAHGLVHGEAGRSDTTATSAVDDAEGKGAAEEQAGEGTMQPREVDGMTAPHSTGAFTTSKASPLTGGLHAIELGQGEATLPTQAKPDVLERSGLDLAREAQLAGHTMETGCSGQGLSESRRSNGGRTDWTGTGVVQTFRTETGPTDRTDSHRTGTEDVLASRIETVQETETGRDEGRLDRV